MKPFVLLATVALIGFLPGASVLADENPVARDLFNGTDLTGWVPEGQIAIKDKAGKETPVWSVENSLLTCADKGGFGFLRYDLAQFGDFRLHSEYRMSKGCNSGIGIRTGKFDQKKFDTRPSVFAYEIQLLDDAGKKPDEHSTGSLYGYVAPTKIATKPAGEWNEMDIECLGPHLKITVNAEVVLDVDQSQRTELKNKPLQGYISLQNHGHKVEFKKLTLVELKASP